MRVLCVGGGSGGHVSPVVAVINELAKHDPALAVLFVCDKAFVTQSRGLMDQAAVPVTVRTITAGKFRRYSHLTRMRQLLMPRLVMANLVDIFKVAAGILQSIWVVLRWKPDVAFAKGGYVCLPMGIATWIARVPLVIHDSDTRPGLTSRVLSRWARAIGTGSPIENYGYPEAITQYVGVPIASDFRPFTAKQHREAKVRLGIDADRPLVVVTGGGLGATSINTAVVGAAPKLLANGVALYHITGKDHYESVVEQAPRDPHYRVVPFVFKDMPQVLGAADIVIARGSATFTQELAGVGVPVVMVPARQLGDQLKNARTYAAADAVVVLSDDELGERGRLAEVVEQLLADPDRCRELAKQLHTFARPDAARDMAKMIRQAAKAQ